MEDVDRALAELIAAIVGRVTPHPGRSIHLHQLDGARTEAMVYLDAAGARVEWVHGKGDCAVTGEGGAILDVLRGSADAAGLEAESKLVLYGDRELIGALGSIFAGAAEPDD